ncbi:MAG: phosphoribosylformylglycinamidine cyclo-ligase [Candidatus Aramenus sp.]|nr:phosphoribosylformylglycinamidine cyclo-ligase [Candidatus Aramenus sp.]
MVTKYSDAGVDIGKQRELHSKIAEMILSTYKNTVVGAGHYSGVVRVGTQNIAIHVDGVGTKTVLSLKTGIYEPIGVDCVAMNVNDLVSVGARPVALVDYLALERPMEDVVEQLIKGLVKGAKESDAEVVGGETAIMQGVVNGYDIACTAIGVVDSPKLGNEVRPGDVVLGLGSNGVHANGFSLVRKLIDEGKLSLKDWGEELMKPTKIYVKEILAVLDKVKAVAHVTGGSFTKLRRVTKYGLELRMPEPQEVFKEIEKAGVPHDEMYRVFNMGVGMVVFTDIENAEVLKNFLSRYHEVFELGKVTEGDKIKIITYKNEILYL